MLHSARATTTKRSRASAATPLVLDRCSDHLGRDRGRERIRVVGKLLHEPLRRAFSFLSDRSFRSSLTPRGARISSSRCRRWLR